MTQAESQSRLSRGFLATEVAGPQEKGLARLVIAISLLGFVAAVPLVRIRLPELPAFLSAYEAALLTTDLITAVLLFSQYSRLRSWALLLLASGYLFDAMMIVPHALSFPGVFSDTGLLGAGPQTTAWLYMLWHLGFPLFVLGFALMARTEADTMTANPTRAVAGAVFAVSLLVAALTLLATVGHDLLPVVMTGGNYSLNVTKGFAPAIWLVTAIVLAVLYWRSVPTLLELWIMVVLVAWLLDVAFAAVFGANRYDFGFYSGRLYGLVAASFVLITLLVEATRLYGRLGGALALAERRNADLAQSREEFAHAQRFETIGQLVAGVAHDFNNVLTVVSGGLDMVLRDPAIGEKNQHSLEASLRVARRGERLTEQLLSFASRRELRPEILNANDVISQLEPLIAKAAGENLRVKTSLSAVIWPARFDRTQFETALLNLVSNARDAMNGTGELTIETANATLGADTFPDTLPGDYLVAKVTDTGPGMPAEVAAHAFDPFFTTKPAAKGTGLGLSQVHGFARRARGQAAIDSTPGTGTTIAIYLPRSAAQAAPPREPFALAPIQASSGGERVLVVEDNPDVLDVAVSGLAELGYRVRTASDAQAALNLLREDAGIDVLFSDVVMPGGMNGAQLAVEAQRIRPGLKVLLTSGYGASALRREHGLADNVEVLNKPYRPEELASKLRRAIGEKR